MHGALTDREALARTQGPVGGEVICTAPDSAVDARVRGSRRTKTLYDVLGVSPDADDESIEKAYREAIKAYHPDRHGGDQKAVSWFQDIVAAAAVLRDPDQRAAYDLKLRLERRRRREWAAAAILCATAGAIIGGGLASGRLTFFSTPPRITAENAPSVPGPSASEIAAASAVQPSGVEVRTEPDKESSAVRNPDTSVTAGGHAERADESRLASTESPQRHLDASEIALLMKRGTELVANGNIGAARMIFQPAAEAGDPMAAFVLAETYDPSVLEKLGARGITPDAVLAERWYEKARALGSTAAPGQLVRLTR